MITNKKVMLIALLTFSLLVTSSFVYADGESGGNLSLEEQVAALQKQVKQLSAPYRIEPAYAGANGFKLSTSPKGNSILTIAGLQVRSVNTNKLFKYTDQFPVETFVSVDGKPYVNSGYRSADVAGTYFIQVAPYGLFNIVLVSKDVLPEDAEIVVSNDEAFPPFTIVQPG